MSLTDRLMIPISHMRVLVVPDDDAEAVKRYPPQVVEQLGDGDIIRGGDTFYMRASTWERVKHRFPQRG